MFHIVFTACPSICTLALPDMHRPSNHKTRADHCYTLTLLHLHIFTFAISLLLRYRYQIYIHHQTCADHCYTLTLLHLHIFTFAISLLLRYRYQIYIHHQTRADHYFTLFLLCTSHIITFAPLHQVHTIKQALPHVTIVANGNVITHQGAFTVWYSLTIFIVTHLY